MSEVQEVHQNDIGTLFVITVTEDGAVVDISSATVLKMIFQYRDRTTLEVDAYLFTDGTDGKLAYVTLAGDMSIVGTTRIQAFVTISGGSWYTDKGEFRIMDNLGTI